MHMPGDCDSNSAAIIYLCTLALLLRLYSAIFPALGLRGHILQYRCHAAAANFNEVVFTTLSPLLQLLQ